MKKILIIIAICVSYTSIAQNLESKIPNSAQAVVSVNGSNLLELISIAEFDKYSFSKEIFGEFNRKDREEKIQSIADFGFEINSKGYYFYKPTDSVKYHTFMVKLADRNKFESLLSKRDKEKIERKDGMNIFVESSAVAMWNDQMLVFTGSDRSYSYFDQNKERLMKLAENDNDDFYDIKRRLVKVWTAAHVKSVFNGSSGNSILTNKSYVSSKDAKAEASAWIKNYGELISSAVDLYRFSGLPRNSFNSSLFGLESITSNLYLEDDAMRMTGEMEIDENWQKIFKKMYNSKMNSNFFKYFDQNQALAYMSFSMDMQAVFEEYPAMMASIYGSVLPEAREEIQVGTELISILMDEEAIGDLVTGDMLFILNDFGEKEVTYTSYEYDEDYKRKEVTKTKVDVLPDFTFMIGSKKGKFLTKAALLGVKHKLGVRKGGYFKILAPKSEIPFDMYTAVKNDILFFTTSEDRIKNILNGTHKSDLGKHKKLIKNNVSTIYVNGEKLMDKIPSDELSRREREFLKYGQDHYKDAYFKTSKIKGNKMKSEVKINIKDSKENSLKLMFNYIDLLAK